MVHAGFPLSMETNNFQESSRLRSEPTTTTRPYWKIGAARTIGVLTYRIQHAPIPSLWASKIRGLTHFLRKFPSEGHVRTGMVALFTVGTISQLVLPMRSLVV